MAAVLLVSHEVSDFDSWKKGFDAHGDAREGARFEALFVGRDAGNDKLVHIGFRVPSADAARAFISNPELAETMKKAGVVGKPDIRIVVTD